MENQNEIKDNQPCKGFLGRWFGHRFRRYLLKSAYKPRDFYSVSINDECCLLKYIDSQRNEYVVVCQRCGLELTKDQCES